MTDSQAGKTNMTFILTRGVFNTSEAFLNFNSTALHLRVGFFDEGHGSWMLEVGYSKSDNDDPKFEKIGSVTKSNSGEWIEARATIKSATVTADETVTVTANETATVTADETVTVTAGVTADFTLQDISHLRLTDTDAGLMGKKDDDTFGWIEVSKIAFTYNFTTSVINITG